MKGTTCEVDGVTYELEPDKDGSCSCGGCAAEGDLELCGKMGDCMPDKSGFPDFYIWVAKSPPGH